MGMLGANPLVHWIWWVLAVPLNIEGFLQLFYFPLLDCFAVKSSVTNLYSQKDRMPVLNNFALYLQCAQKQVPNICFSMGNWRCANKRKLFGFRYGRSEVRIEVGRHPCAKLMRPPALEVEELEGNDMTPIHSGQTGSLNGWFMLIRV